MTSHVKRTELFRALHGRGEVLLLPNAWNAGSARVFEAEGFAAIGTTSAGIAASLGCPTANACLCRPRFRPCARSSEARTSRSGCTSNEDTTPRTSRSCFIVSVRENERQESVRPPVV